jgi:hypothetical protein
MEGGNRSTKRRYRQRETKRRNNTVVTQHEIKKDKIRKCWL